MEPTRATPKVFAQVDRPRLLIWQTKLQEKVVPVLPIQISLFTPSILYYTRPRGHWKASGLSFTVHPVRRRPFRRRHFYDRNHGFLLLLFPITHPRNVSSPQAIYISSEGLLDEEASCEESNIGTATAAAEIKAKRV